MGRDDGSLAPFPSPSPLPWPMAQTPRQNADHTRRHRPRAAQPWCLGLIGKRRGRLQRRLRARVLDKQFRQNGQRTADLHSAPTQSPLSTTPISRPSPMPSSPLAAARYRSHKLSRMVSFVSKTCKLDRRGYGTGGASPAFKHKFPLALKGHSSRNKFALDPNP